MKFPRPIIVISLALLVALTLALLVVPMLVASGVRTWVWYYARQQGFAVEIAAVDAPLFRPVVLHNVHVRGLTPTGLEVNLEIDRVQFGLDFRAILSRSDARRLRDLSISGAHAALRKLPAPLTASGHARISPLTQLFADTFRVSHLDLRFENSGTIVEARDASIFASEVETGSLAIADLAIASPLISKRFTNLRGATSWENERLTLGAITLARGVDIDAITADFSHAAAHRIGLEVNVDVFGGKVRANVMSDTRDNRQSWDIAGTASEISLAQMSKMLAWHQPASGALRTCKFTFRGDVSEPLQSTASIWAEVNDLTFADRRAETIMLGGSIYNRRMHLEQLYVKQPNNQFTLSGDSPLPSRAEEWTKGELNADLSANIGDLDCFARLFGARAGEYTGAIAADGTFVSDDRKSRATLSATGEIQLLDARVAEGARLSADLSCNGGQATLRYAEFRNGDADIAVWGEIMFADLRRFEAKLFPTAPLAEITSTPTGSCIRRLALSPIANDDNTHSVITEIAVHGGLSQSDWGVSLRSTGADNTDVVRTFRICPATDSAHELSLVARAPTAR